MNSRSFCRFVAALLVTATVTPVFAWGDDGHRIVAMLAEAQLSHAARVEVARLLAQEPGETLASISNWADRHRNPATASLHYGNFLKDSCSYDAIGIVWMANAFVAAIEKPIEILKTEGDDQKRLLALKYPVHSVADVPSTQPGNFV